MIKQIKRYGKGLIIRLNSDDCDFFGIKEGDFVDISEMTKVKRKGGKK